MAVHRIICRWDFKLRPILLDQPGAVCEALGADSRWAEIKQNTRHNQFTLERREAGLLEQITFSPAVAVFNAEWVDGVPLDRLAESTRLLDLFAALDKIKEMARISALHRCGLRFVSLDQIAPELARVPAGEQVLIGRMMNHHAPGVDAMLRGTLGDVSDASFRYVGSHQDGIGYSFSYGPFNVEERPKFLEHVPVEEWPRELGADFVCDADFFESNFELKVSMKRWAKPIVARYEKSLKAVQQLLRAG